jgi:hypothetical protein
METRKVWLREKGRGDSSEAWAAKAKPNVAVQRCLVNDIEQDQSIRTTCGGRDLLANFSQLLNKWQKEHPWDRPL